MTNSKLRIFFTPSAGFELRISRSACLPTSTVPASSDISSASAPFFVAILITSKTGMPASTNSSNSRYKETPGESHGFPRSVPDVIKTPLFHRRFIIF